MIDEIRDAMGTRLKWQVFEEDTFALAHVGTFALLAAWGEDDEQDCCVELGWHDEESIAKYTPPGNPSPLECQKTAEDFLLAELLPVVEALGGFESRDARIAELEKEVEIRAAWELQVRTLWKELGGNQ